MSKPEISIIVPFYNEAENIPDLLNEIRAACPAAEIVAVDDGSTDASAAILSREVGIQVVTFPTNRGQSAALYAGLRRAGGRICVMLDGDGQNDPADIPALVAALADCDLACGWRRNRRDTWNRRVSSRIANRVRRAFLKDGIRDTGCSLKALRREHIDLLVPFNGLHRYIPALMRNAGLRLVEVPVNHRPRLRGVSKYTIGGRALRGIRDLFGVSWLLTRQIRFPAGVFDPSPVSAPIETTS